MRSRSCSGTERRPKRGFALLAIGALLASSAVWAADMREVTVDRDGKHYRMRSEVFFDVDRETLYDVFSNWDLSTEFSSWIVEARNLEPDETGKPGFYIKNHGCLLFVCKTLIRIGYVEQEPHTYLHASADAERSDFAISDETWRFETEGDGTVVYYELEMSPKFWVPPVIGPWVIKRKLKNDGGEALDRIEAIAQEKAKEREQEQAAALD